MKINLEKLNCSEVTVWHLHNKIIITVFLQKIKKLRTSFSDVLQAKVGINEFRKLNTPKKQTLIILENLQCYLNH